MNIYAAPPLNSIWVYTSDRILEIFTVVHYQVFVVHPFNKMEKLFWFVDNKQIEIIDKLPSSVSPT